MTPTRDLVRASVIEFISKISFKGWIILGIGCGLSAWGAASLIPSFECEWQKTCLKAPPPFRP